MRRILIAISLLSVVSCSNGEEDGLGEPEKGAEAAPKAPDAKTVEGVLEYYPQDVKSVQAWLGHEFMIGKTPIRATETISSETLRKMVGRKVKIEGEWNAGEEWMQADEEIHLQNPSFPEGEIVIRGSGIEAVSVSIVDE